MSETHSGYSNETLSKLAKKVSPGPQSAVIRALATELLAARREGGAQEWQPMDSAPKDGTAILIFDPEGKREHHMPDEARRPGECSWRTDDPRMVYFDDKRYAIGYWRPAWGGGWGNRNASTVTPTHWMPLPATPDAKEGEGL